MLENLVISAGLLDNNIHSDFRYSDIHEEHFCSQHLEPLKNLPNIKILSWRETFTDLEATFGKSIWFLILVNIEFPCQFFSASLAQSSFPLWKTKHFLGQFMTADDMHDSSSGGTFKMQGFVCKRFLLISPHFSCAKILKSSYPPTETNACYTV